MNIFTFSHISLLTNGRSSSEPDGMRLKFKSLNLISWNLSQNNEKRKNFELMR